MGASDLEFAAILCEQIEHKHRYDLHPASLPLSGHSAPRKRRAWTTAHELLEGSLIARTLPSPKRRQHASGCTYANVPREHTKGYPQDCGWNEKLSVLNHYPTSPLPVDKL